MDEKISRNPDLPIYNIKAVSRLVGLLPVTLRAWERRYGIPQPNRGEQGYRYYSEHDIRTLRWLKTQVESGLSIGRAVEYLSELRASGYDPAVESIYQSRQATNSTAMPTLTDLSDQLLEALIHFDEPEAVEVTRRAFAMYSMEQVLIEVMQPVLVTLGEGWHRGELPIALEHYATQFCMQHLMSMMAAAAPPTHPGKLVAACAPGEMHQVGLLMMVVMLRWRGWNVKYLGPDLPLERLEEALQTVQPQMLLFSANRMETAQQLLRLPDILTQIQSTPPIVVLGGQAFAQMRLPEDIPAVYLSGSPNEMIRRIEDMMVHALPATSN